VTALVVTLKNLADRGRMRGHDQQRPAQVVDVPVGADHQTVVREQHGPSLGQAAEHRRLHVVDVVVRAVDGGWPGDRSREAAGDVPGEQGPLGRGLETAVGGDVGFHDRAVLPPREGTGHPVQALRRNIDVAADPAGEQVEKVSGVSAAGDLGDTGHVEDRVPFAAGQRRAHRRRVGPVRDQPGHRGRQLDRGDAAVEHGHVGAVGGQDLD
jgi:hypothetical protein